MDNFSAAHRKHLDSALDLIRKASRPVPDGNLYQIFDRLSQAPPNFTRDASLSLCAESIAQSLSDAGHLKVGAEPRKLSELIQTQRERYRRLSEQAIASIEPSCYDDAIEQTVGRMLNAQYTKPMDTEELIRETLATFLAEMNK